MAFFCKYACTGYLANSSRKKTHPRAETIWANSVQERGTAHIGPSRPKLKLGQRGGALGRWGSSTGPLDLTDAVNAIRGRSSSRS